MYEIIRQEDKYILKYITKNIKGQILYLEIFCCDYNICTSKAIYNVTFHITTKRKKGYQEDVETGLDGIKSLIWAKRCLIDVIDFFKKNEWDFKSLGLIVNWSDLRRKKAYCYGLRDLNFKLTKFDKYNVLYLKII